MRSIHELLTAERHGDAGADVIAESDRAHERCAVDAESLARDQCGRYDSAARMRERGRMRVVGLVGLCEDAIRESGFDRPAHYIRADDRGHLFAAVGAG